MKMKLERNSSEIIFDETTIIGVRYYVVQSVKNLRGLELWWIRFGGRLEAKQVLMASGHNVYISGVRELRRL